MMSTGRLTPTSHLVLGLLAREGPSTPYDLEQHVRATLGNFWSFPHALLYSEPPRLAALGLATEARETEGRRRRVFAITPAGVAGLTSWLDRPSGPAELRDPGLLQLFFADLASGEARLRLAERQLAIHQAKLAAYREDERQERRPSPLRRGQRTVEHWRGETLPMGLRYEEAAVEFWTDVVAKATAAAEGTTAEG
jgi:PadR family transcriptional regulator AphA